MKKILVILIILGLGLYGNQAFKKHKQEQLSDTSEASAAENFNRSPSEPSASNGQFKCDGRTYCSQMTSCEEATFFLKNCPDTKMDGNNDGVPCEKQWCK